MPVDSSLAIIGAGPAGLVAALTARKLGLNCELFEAAPHETRIGGGLLMHSNGQRVLQWLGLLGSFEPKMRRIETVNIVAAGGRVLCSPNFDALTVPHARPAVVMRSALQEHLLQAVESAGVMVHRGHRLCGLSERAGAMRLVFENGATAEAHVVIAADGTHSATRQAAEFAFRKIAIGETWLRGISPVEMRGAAEIWGDDGRRVGFAPLPDADGQPQAYFFCRVPMGQWNDIRTHRLDAWLESWRPFGPDARRLLRAVPDWNAVNRSELWEVRARSWHRGRTFLIGDAAHAMTPNLGQGANSAMVDALVLTQLLARADSSLASLEALHRVGREYQAVRQGFVTQLQTASRQTGQLASRTGFTAQLLRHTAFGLSRHLPPLGRAMPRLSTGWNPREAQFFA